MLNEKLLIKLWKKEKVYEAKNYTFSIDSPPPSISGEPHIGTAFGYILKDIIARYKRIFGERVFYSLGFDNNGLPTEKLVEKKIQKPLRNLDKEDAHQICLDIITEEEKKFESIFEEMGLSHDTNLKYQTINELSQKIAQDSFIDLYKKNLIYRSESPIIWDTKDQTALSQSDLEDIEMKTKMYYINFLCENENVTIATTRPELIPSISAIFFHAEDTRYQHLINKKAFIPIINTEVPILSDNKVDQNKGSGLVMCCTFGDTNDIYWWKKYKLPTKMLFTKYGTISDNINQFSTNIEFNKKLIDQKICSAKAIIIEEFKPYIEKSIQISHSVKCAERSKTPIEYIISPQWMLKITHIKNELKEKANEIQWHPKHMKNLLFQWIDGLSWNWCISRQRSFGVNIPVWYTKSNEVILANKTPIDTSRRYPDNQDKDNIVLNNDVFDTWWTSSLTPQINQKQLFVNNVMSLRTQGHEIIRTWAFYTILKSYLHNDTIPWSNIFIHGWCLAEDKTKMSKSKGNIVSPINIIKQYGADSLRYWTANSSPGQDTSYSENIVKIGKKITKKLHNASVFISQFNLNYDIKAIFEIDLWIINRVNQLKTNIENYMKYFNYTKIREELDKFFLDTFCDYYIEIVKTRAYNDNNLFSSEESQSSIYALHYVIKVCLIAYGPIMPFITDSIWRDIFKYTDSIHKCGIWHKFQDKIIIKNTINQEITNMLNVIEDIRKEKTLRKLSMNSQLNKVEIKYQLSDNIIKEIKTTLKIKEIIMSGKTNSIL